MGSNPSPGSSIASILQALQTAIWEYRPILGEIMQKHGEKSLTRYAQDFFDVNPLPSRITDRRGELTDAIETLVANRLGKKVATQVAAQLKEFPLVSTSDHHAIIDNPYWVNANIITALPCIAKTTKQKMPFLIVFSFASVSLNNSSGFPRGLEFHGGMKGDGATVRLPILPDKLKMGTVYGMRGFTKEDLSNAERLLGEREKQGEVTAEKAALLRELLDGPLSSDDVLSLPLLSDQITLLNYRLWPNLFHEAGKKEASGGIPDLLYLDIETIVTHLLLTKLLDDPKSLVARALFDPPFTQAVLKHFDSIPGAFQQKEETGTYFFWAVDEKYHRIRLMVKDGMLSSRDGAVKIPLTPLGIAEALREKKIFPSTALSYLVIALYYGMKCLGGFCQVHDLTVLKYAWQEVLNDCGEAEESKALTDLQTKEMNAGGMILTYFRKNGDFVMPTGIDMLLERAEDTRPETYLKEGNALTLSASMDPMLPSCYSVFFPIHQRKIDISGLTFDAVARSTGLFEKLL